MGRLLMAATFFFAVSATAGNNVKTTCVKEDPRYKVVSTLEVQKDSGAIISSLEVDGRKIEALQKICLLKRCPHRDGENVVEVYPQFGARETIEKVDLLFWSGANVNRISLTDCKSK